MKILEASKLHTLYKDFNDSTRKLGNQTIDKIGNIDNFSNYRKFGFIFLDRNSYNNYVVAASQNSNNPVDFPKGVYLNGNFIFTIEQNIINLAPYNFIGDNRITPQQLRNKISLQLYQPTRNGGMVAVDIENKIQQKTIKNAYYYDLTYDNITQNDLRNPTIKNLKTIQENEKNWVCYVVSISDAYEIEDTSSEIMYSINIVASSSNSIYNNNTDFKKMAKFLNSGYIVNRPVRIVPNNGKFKYIIGKSGNNEKVIFDISKVITSPNAYTVNEIIYSDRNNTQHKFNNIRLDVQTFHIVV